MKKVTKVTVFRKKHNLRVTARMKVKAGTRLSIAVPRVGEL